MGLFTVVSSRFLYVGGVKWQDSLSFSFKGLQKGRLVSLDQPLDLSRDILTLSQPILTFKHKLATAA